MSVCLCDACVVFLQCSENICIPLNIACVALIISCVHQEFFFFFVAVGLFIPWLVSSGDHTARVTSERLPTVPLNGLYWSLLSA